jgi:hypothetical protein
VSTVRDVQPGLDPSSKLGILSNRWVGILWHCLSRGVHYDQAIHQANRERSTAT